MAEVNVLKQRWITGTAVREWYVDVGEETPLDTHVDENTLRHLLSSLQDLKYVVRPQSKTPSRIKKALWNFRLSKVIGYLTGRYV